jgi:predicted metal-dependent phosphoesterase TrpH
MEILDLHNHTYHSYDSSNRLEDYRRAHERGLFDVVAITDHNTIAGAVELAAAADFPVIVGQEIDTADGELIGLFLERPVARGQSVADTAREIRDQGGLTYLQHPFYPYISRTLSRPTIDALVRDGLIDIVEGVNGGPFTGNSNLLAQVYARAHELPIAAASDAHYPRDIGRCGVRVPAGPLTAASVKERLRDGTIVDRRRSSVGSLADRGLYLARGAAGRLRGAPRKLR